MSSCVINVFLSKMWILRIIVTVDCNIRRRLCRCNADATRHAMQS